MTRSFFAYHLTHFFGPFGMQSYHTNSDKPTEGDLIYVVSGDESDEGGKDYALEGLFKIHRRITGPFNLKSLRGEARDFEYRLSLVPVRMPLKPILMRDAVWYDKKDVHRYFSSGQNFNPVRPEYKERFDQLLVQFSNGSNDLSVDLDEVSRRTDIPVTTREALVQARVGQGRFRSEVTALWGRGEVCALTGIDIPELLIASHIKPWRDSTDEERLDPCNGLLLATHVDKTFDRYLLSFREDRENYWVSIHPRAQGVLRKLGVSSSMKLAVAGMSLTQGRAFQQYMVDHYRKHQEQIAQDAPTTVRS